MDLRPQLAYGSSTVACKGEPMAARHICLVLVLMLVAAGCGGAAQNGSTPGGAAAFVAAGDPTPTPLATEPANLVPVPVVATKAPAKSGSYYKPPGWDGVSDVDCKDFDTHAHAQSFFKGTGGSKTNDPYRLDGDHDGVACETLP